MSDVEIWQHAPGNEDGRLTIYGSPHGRREEPRVHELDEAAVALGQYVDIAFGVAQPIRLGDLLAGHLEVVEGVALRDAGRRCKQLVD